MMFKVTKLLATLILRTNPENRVSISKSPPIIGKSYFIPRYWHVCAVLSGQSSFISNKHVLNIELRPQRFQAPYIIQ